MFAEFNCNGTKMLFNADKIKCIEENKDGSATIWDINSCGYNLEHSYVEVKESLFTYIEGDENGD